MTLVTLLCSKSSSRRVKLCAGSAASVPCVTRQLLAKLLKRKPASDLCYCLESAVAAGAALAAAGAAAACSAASCKACCSSCCAAATCCSHCNPCTTLAGVWKPHTAVMRFTSCACRVSHCIRLHSCSSIASGLMVMAVLQALHCCTAAFQALHVRAAAHRIRGSVLSTGCCSAMASGGMLLSASAAWRCTQQQQQQQASALGSFCAYTHAMMSGQPRHVHRAGNMLDCSKRACR